MCDLTTASAAGSDFAHMASSWLSDTLNRAATSAQRLAEQAELTDKFKRAATSVQQLTEQPEWQEFGNKVRASAQSFAEQSEAALRASKESVVSGVSALGLLQADDAETPDEGSVVELKQRFISDTAVFRPSASSGPKLAEIAQTLRRWMKRLDKKGAAGKLALEALLQSQAFQTSLIALTRSQVGRVTIGSAASCDGKTAVSEAASLLCKVFSCVSDAKPAVLQQLLQLLANAADAEARRSRSRITDREADEQKHYTEWVLTLLSAAIIDPSELTIRESSRHQKQLERAIGSVFSMERSMTRIRNAGAAQPTLPEEGVSVWAEWPGNGGWYRARVKSTANEEVEVEWLRPPPDVECGRDAEYLISAVGDETSLATLGVAATVPDDQERPAAATAVGKESWTQHVEAVEALSSSYRELKDMSERSIGLVEQPKGGAAANTLLAEIEESVSKLRQDINKHKQSLTSTVEAPEECSDQHQGIGKDSDAERTAAQQEPHPLHTHVMELQRQREELLAKLKVVDDELEVANAALKKSMEASEEGDAGGPSRQHFVSCMEAVSSEIDALLSTRIQEAAALGTGGGVLDSGQLDVALACLTAERLRRRQLEELLAGLKAATWGPDAQALARDPTELAGIRKIIARAGGMIELAWKDMVQLAAETLGDGGTLRANSEDMSRAARRYKEMRLELVDDLDRLAKLEAVAAQSAFVPPPRQVSGTNTGVSSVAHA